MRSIRIGSGAGYGGDRIEPAIDLMNQGNLDYIIFECLAERTIALNQLAKLKDPKKGYNDLLAYRMEKILQTLKTNKVKVITNMGAANPIAAAEEVCEIAHEQGLSNLKIAAVTGDDILGDLHDYMDYTVIETGKPLRDLQGTIVSANAYIGIQGIVEALDKDADIIITGRVADPSLTLGPLVYEFGWDTEDYDKLGKGTLAGHLLECAGQITGGYYCDPGYKDVEDLWNLGFPIAEIFENGDLTITKLEGTGGLVSEGTCKEQILYEIQDPTQYFTPDCIADFSKAKIETIKRDKVKISGISGKKSNGFLKVSIGYKDCFIGEAQISYGGATALERAKLAAEIVKKRLELTGCQFDELRIDYMGVNSLYNNRISEHISRENPCEIRLRVAARTKDDQNAKMIGNEVEALYTNGPGGGGGVTTSIREIISVASILVPKDVIRIKVKYYEV